MEIIDIIKEAFIFPSNNLEKLAIYIVLTFVMGMLLVGGIFSFVFSSQSGAFLILGLILCIVALVLALIVGGYQLSIMKSGMDQDEDAPAFDWKNNVINGIKLIVLSIVYFIIPAIIVAIVALLTNIPGNVMQIIQEYFTSINATAAVNSTASAVAPVSSVSWAALGTSLAITAIAIILFIIFAFIQIMGQARLAKTGSLGNALNIIEAAKDIPRIGVGKVIAVVLLVVIVIVVVQGILGYVYGQIPQLVIISIIVTPYLKFFTQRAYGLLYSDIA